MIEEITQNNLDQSKSEVKTQSEMPKSSSNKKIIAFLFILFILITGIMGAFLVKQYRFPEVIPVPTTMPTPNAELSPAPYILEASPSMQLSQAHNYFGFNIFHQLLNEDKGKNIFISPLSIHLALSMTYNGADSTTKEAMAKTLQIQQMDINQLNKDSSALIDLLQNPDPKVEILIANSIWMGIGENFNPDFLTANQTYYKAKLDSLDFNDPKSADIINSWVSNNTKGKIPTIIIPPIPPDMVMYLINAVYFKGNWTVEFDKKLTTERLFTLTDGSQKEYPMMQQKGNFLYFENDQFQSVNIPYGKNKRLGMHVFLPKGNLENFTNELSIENWKKWLTEYKEKEGTIILPKYKIEYKKNLNDVLKSLGMAVAFSSQADFSRMRENPKLKDLYISEVIHKTYVDVNEEGTEAAAVTEVGMAKTVAIQEKKTFYMEINRPFYFAIADNQTSEILFMGIILEPK